MTVPGWSARTLIELGDRQADFTLGDFTAPCIHHLLAHVGNDDRLVPGVHVCKGSHVAGALHVVLATECTDTATTFAEVTGDHLEVCDRFDIVDTCRVLGNTHGVQDVAGLGLCNPLGRGGNVFCRDLRDPGDILKRVLGFHHDFLELVEVLGPLCNEFLVLPAVLDDVLHDTVQERNIRSRVKGHVEIRKFGGWRKPWICTDDFCTTLLGEHDLPPDQRVLLDGVAAKDEDAFGLTNIGYRVGHGAGAKSTGKTDHGRCVTEPGTVVNIGRFQNRTGKLLHQVVLFIGDTG